MAGMTSTTSTSNTEPTSYFIRVGSVEFSEGVRTTYVTSTQHAQGAWQDDELHMAAVSGLVANEQEVFEPRDNFLPVRTSFDILGKLHAGDMKVVTENIRPGRTIELIQSTVYAQGRAVLVGRTWRVISTDTTAAELIADQPMTPIDQCKDNPEFNDRWPGGYVASIQSKTAPDHGPAHGRAWITTPYDVIEGETPSPWIKMLSVIDAANGIAPAREPFKDGVSFANVDLTIHLYRKPVGNWVGLSTSQSLAGSGAGLTSSYLHDVEGPVGRAEQALTVRMVE